MGTLFVKFSIAFYFLICTLKVSLRFLEMFILFGYILIMSGTKSNTKLFVGGLPYQLRGRDLREIFSEYGEVVFARVILDRDTKRSKGF
jgi:hypothetical protein